MFRQQVVPLHAPFFNQIHFPNPKLNPRLKNLIIQGTHPIALADIAKNGFPTHSLAMSAKKFLHR